MKILIVDDRASNLKLLRVLLESEGYSVCEAYDGVEALTILRSEPVDALISDILMPNMDGFRLCHEIRASESPLCTLPIVFYTATYTSPGDQKLADTVGADAYVLKPAKIEQLVAALNEAKEKSAARRSNASTYKADELFVMKEYNVALVRKLEQKNDELELAMIELKGALEKAEDLNKNLEIRVEERTRELLRSTEEVKTLRGLLPICSNCKKIRDDEGHWQVLEGYIMKHTNSKFSHGICDDCGQKLYGEDWVSSTDGANPSQ